MTRLLRNQFNIPALLSWNEGARSKSDHDFVTILALCIVYRVFTSPLMVCASVVIHVFCLLFQTKLFTVVICRHNST